MGATDASTEDTVLLPSAAVDVTLGREGGAGQSPSPGTPPKSGAVWEKEYERRLRGLSSSKNSIMKAVRLVGPASAPLALDLARPAAFRRSSSAAWRLLPKRRPRPFSESLWVPSSCLLPMGRRREENNENFSWLRLQSGI